ncbi:MAG: flagellar biosynthesis anti-sigma factor FlgM [Nitrospirales bacterium]|nr:flagellar biosynthesis anti-sigma factor FlgM [Nitrospirales bacterium]
MSSFPSIPPTPSPSNPGFPNESSQVTPENDRKPMTTSEKSLTEESSIHLSPDGQNLSTYQNQMNELPEIREDRISQLQRSIEHGTYSVSAEQLAEKLVQEL